MRRTPSQVDQASLYEAALEGLEIQKRRLEEQIHLVRSLTGGKTARAAKRVSVAAEAPTAKASKASKKTGRKQRRKRILSPEARKRIAEAQRKRWAAYREDTEA